MVLSALGLIVAAGMMQLFVNISSQIKLMENKEDLRNLTALLEEHLSDDGACYQSLNNTGIRNFLYSGGTGSLDFTPPKDSKGNTVIDLSNLDSKFGLTGYTKFRLQCGSSSCKDCNTAGSWSVIPGTGTVCQNSWDISLISQSALKRVTRFNKPQKLVTVQVNFTDSTDSTKWNCGGISLSSVLQSIQVDCMTLRDKLDWFLGDSYLVSVPPLTYAYFYYYDHRTLAGCGNHYGNLYIGPYSGYFKHTADGKTYWYNSKYFSSNKGTTVFGVGGPNVFGSATFVTGNKLYVFPDNSVFGFQANKGDAVIGAYSKLSPAETVAIGSHALGNVFWDNGFIGYKAGINAKPGNIFIGSKSGYKNTSGSNNIYINDQGAKTESGIFRVGGWLYGDMSGDTFKVNNKQVSYDGHTHTPVSSRHVKKNIKPFKDFKKSLQDILKTPLFTFQFKKDHLEKDHIGVISEELPSHLQIKEKDKPSRPDWISIYGTFWGSIKALYDLLAEYKEEHQENHKFLSVENNKLYMDLGDIRKKHESLSQENKELNTEIKRLEGEIKDIKKEKIEKIERLEGQIKEIEKKCGI